MRRKTGRGNPIPIALAKVFNKYAMGSYLDKKLHNPGVKFIIGFRKSSTKQGKGASEVQSVLFDRGQYTPLESRTWLHQHGFKVTGLDDDAGQYYRSRQVDPGEFVGFRTIDAGGRHNTPKSVARNPSTPIWKEVSEWSTREKANISADQYRRWHRPVRITVKRGVKYPYVVSVDMNDDNIDPTLHTTGSYIRNPQSTADSLYEDSHNTNPSVGWVLSINTQLSRTPPNSYNQLDGPFDMILSGTPVEIVGGKGKRVLVKANYYGTPYWGWVTKDSHLTYDRAKQPVRGNPDKQIPIWGYNSTTGVWDHVRDSLIENVSEWLNVLNNDTSIYTEYVAGVKKPRKPGKPRRIKNPQSKTNPLKDSSKLNWILHSAYLTKKEAHGVAKALRYNLDYNIKVKHIPNAGYAVYYSRTGTRREVNPQSVADELFEDFHGEPPTGEDIIIEEDRYNKHLSKMGDLVQLEILADNGKSVIPIKFLDEFNPEKDIAKLDKSGIGTIEVCNANKHQLEFVGGDQDISTAYDALEIPESERDKDLVTVGEVNAIVYFTKKVHLQGPKTSEPFHHEFAFNEETKKPEGEKPVLIFDSKNRKLMLSGGTYKIEDIGIVG